MYTDIDSSSIPTNIFPGANLVLGDGPNPCKWMFVGEAPGADEDSVTHRPFTGPSGRLLFSLLEYYTNLRRPTVYVTNIVKHRPPYNRTPKVSEIKAYLPYFYEELSSVCPDVVVTLGAPAAKVFDKSVKVTEDHGTAREIEIPGVWKGVLVTWFHPAFALRSPYVFEQLTGDAARLSDVVTALKSVVPHTDYSLVDESEVVSFLLSRWGDIGFDTETTSPTRQGVFMTDEADLVGYSISWAPYQGRYISCPDGKIGVGMAAILESSLWRKVCHNTKFEYKILQKQGINLVNYEDTRIAAYLLGESRTGLKTLTKQYLGVRPISYEEVTGGRQMSELAPEDVAEYASMDADHTMRLWPMFNLRLEKAVLGGVYEDIERPLIPVLSDMEKKGMLVDVERCQEVTKKLLGHVATSSDEVYQAFAKANVPIDNVQSGDQIADALEKLGAPLKKRTELKKRLIVDAEALENIRTWRPDIINPLLKNRKYSKMVGYAHSFMTLRGPDGRLHSSFNQCGRYEESGSAVGTGTATGRFSSSGPNLQNVPNHRSVVDGVNWGDELRSCITAPDDYLLLSADLGQEEPRIAAVLANDQTLIDGFLAGRDIYRPATEALYPYTVCEGRSDKDWKGEWEDWERFIGKTFLLAWYYGAGETRLVELDPTLTSKDAHNGVQMLSSSHPARDVYIKETIQFLQENGYVESMMGRKRWISKIWSPKKKDREEALREAANMRVQGTAADILKIALARIYKMMEGMRSTLVSTVHDEVIIEVHVDEVEEVTRLVAQAFEGLLPTVPLVLETYVGKLWSERRRLT